MSEREDRLIEAAIRVIGRYGIKRTTMGDIANEAGVSRQTLYTCYPSKDEVLRGTIRHMCKCALSRIEAACDSAHSLGEKLDIAFEQLAIEPYRMMHASPEASDIVVGFNEVCTVELQQAGEKQRDIIEAILEPYAASLEGSGLTLRQLADYVRFSTSGFKKSAESEAHLRSLLTTLKTVLLATLKYA